MIGPRPLVLVADDDPDILQLVVHGLRRLGCEIVTAADGEQALALAQEREPAVAVLDVSMPKLSGLKVSEALRSHPATAAIKILLLTARVQERDVESGLRAGADEYVTKPFSPHALAERVQALLDRA